MAADPKTKQFLELVHITRGRPQPMLLVSFKIIIFIHKTFWESTVYLLHNISRRRKKADLPILGISYKAICI